MFNFIKNAISTAKEKAVAVKEAYDYSQAYVDRVQTVVNQIVKTKQGIFQDNAPFKLKKGERYIGSTSAVLGTYKSDGRISASGVTARIPIAKGVSFRMGSGRVSMGKSWVYDQPGTLHFTSERIIFNGVNTNSSVNLTKVIDITLGDRAGNTILIDRETGKDWSFKVNTIPEETLATIFACAKGALQELA